MGAEGTEGTEGAEGTEDAEVTEDTEGTKEWRLRGVRLGLHGGPGRSSHMPEVRVQQGQLSLAPPEVRSGTHLLHPGNEHGSWHGTLSGPSSTAFLREACRAWIRSAA